MANGAGLTLEHDRDAVPYRKGEAVCQTHELLVAVLRRSPVLQRALAQRTDEKFEQADFHGFVFR